MSHSPPVFDKGAPEYRLVGGRHDIHSKSQESQVRL
jgi:hypothetical protein